VYFRLESILWLKRKVKENMSGLSAKNVVREIIEPTSVSQKVHLRLN